MLEKSDFNEASWLRWSADTMEDASILIMGIPFDNAVSLNKGAARLPIICAAFRQNFRILLMNSDL